MIVSFAIPKTVSRITEILEENNFQAFLVGGCVRDLILNKEPKDWDITTDATPEEIIEIFPKTVYENRFGTVTVINEEETDQKLKQIEITPFRTETKYSDKRHPDKVKFSKKIEEDLSRRDFTFNALAYNVSKGQIIDLYSGIKDIKDKVICSVGNPNERFDEDPLRMLRAVRFSTELGFTINQNTLEAIKNNSKLVKNLSKERIRDEFIKIIMSPNPLIGMKTLEELGLLTYVIHETLQMIGVGQNGDHIYDVWEHSLRSLQHAADKNYPLEIRLAALFHDIGKPKTKQYDKNKGDFTFYGHEVVGARITKKALMELKLPLKTIEIVEKLVRYHMFFSDTEKITLSAVRRIINKVGKDLIWDLMDLRICDRIGMGRPKEDPYRLRKYHSMIEEALRDPTSVTMLKIKGNDIIEITKSKPGPKIGYILNALLEEVLENPSLNNKEYLTDKVLELNNLSEKELKDRSESGKHKKEEVENQEIKKIRQKHRVS